MNVELLSGTPVVFAASARPTYGPVSKARLIFLEDVLHRLLRCAHETGFAPPLTDNRSLSSTMVEIVSRSNPPGHDKLKLISTGHLLFESPHLCFFFSSLRQFSDEISALRSGQRAPRRLNFFRHVSSARRMPRGRSSGFHPHAASLIHQSSVVQNAPRLRLEH